MQWASVQVLEHRFRTESGIGQHLLWRCFKIGLYCVKQHRQSVIVCRIVGEFRRYHNVRVPVDHRMGVVAKVIAPRARFMMRLS